jgi:hypothetical protein
MGFKPWHFWQLANDKVPIVAACNTMLWEYAYQFTDGGKGAGRVEIRQSIAEAERRITEYLQYSPAVHWVENEKIQLPAYSRASCQMLADLTEGKVKQIGTPSWEAVQELPLTATSGTPPVTTTNLLDTDGDGIIDSVVISGVAIPAGVVNPTEELALFFLDADIPTGFYDSDLKDWQIRPISVKTVTNATPNTLTITAPAWLFVKPALYEGLFAQPGWNHGITGRDSSGAYDPNVTTNYVSSIGLFKRVVTNANKATLTCDDGCGNLTSYDLCATSANDETGQVTLKPYSATTGQCVPCGGYGGYGMSNWLYGMWGSYYPALAVAKNTYVTISYEAGEKLKDWQMVIARYAAADLMRPLCGCEPQNYEVYKWQMDAAIKDSGFSATSQELENPFGTRAGHIYAYRQYKRYRILKGSAFAGF